MTPDEKKLIAKKLEDLTHITQGEVTPQRIKITLDIVGQFEFTDISHALEKGMMLWKFFPAPAEIIDLLPGHVRLKRMWQLEDDQKKRIGTKNREIE